jgi:RNA polymerase sigma-70 factor (ECF subfamily)
LPERTRQIFLLNRVHACSYDEIAAAFGLSYSTVEREIARALLACRDTLR